MMIIGGMILVGGGARYCYWLLLELMEKTFWELCPSGRIPYHGIGDDGTRRSSSVVGRDHAMLSLLWRLH